MWQDGWGFMGSGALIELHGLGKVTGYPWASVSPPTTWVGQAPWCRRALPVLTFFCAADGRTCHSLVAVELGSGILTHVDTEALGSCDSWREAEPGGNAGLSPGSPEALHMGSRPQEGTRWVVVVRTRSQCLTVLRNQRRGR